MNQGYMAKKLNQSPMVASRRVNTEKSMSSLVKFEGFLWLQWRGTVNKEYYLETHRILGKPMMDGSTIITHQLTHHCLCVNEVLLTVVFDCNSYHKVVVYKDRLRKAIR